MDRLTKKISLVLISSSLFLYGCRHDERDKSNDPNSPGGYSSGGGHGYPHAGHYYGGSGPGTHGVFVHSSSSGSWGSGGRGTSVGGSARGGFGASAHGAHGAGG
jgi:hypothetical protein